MDCYKLDFPINGGWGYAMEDACVIDKGDHTVEKNIPFDGVGVEYAFVEKRIYCELILFLPRGREYSGISWKLLQQDLINRDGRDFDRLMYSVTALPTSDWESLKAEWEGPDGIRSPTFDSEAHHRKHESKTISLVREYWFDITSFYGQTG